MAHGARRKRRAKLECYTVHLRSARERASAMSDRYTLEVQNFGPIVDANVEVRPLTVLAGPSNTGKSYFAVLIYALHRSLCSQYAFSIERALSSPEAHGARPLPRLQLSASMRESVAEWVRRFRSGQEHGSEVPHSFLDYVRRTLEQARPLQNGIAKELCKCFGVRSLDGLVRYPSSSQTSHVGFQIRHAAEDQPASYDFHFGLDANAEAPSGRIPGLAMHLPEATSKSLAMLRKMPVDEDPDLELNYIILSVVNGTFDSVLGPIAGFAYYLPAGRTGLMHSANVFLGTLLQGATTAGLRPSARDQSLPGVLADFLDQLIAVSNRQGNHQNKEDELALAVEKNVLQGTIGVNNDALSYPTFTYRPESTKTDLPLLRASSMVSELAPVVLYLRHWVQPGDTFIIEEPEAHLHPAMQAAFARELARLVRAGIRVVLTTHSEWLLEQIGNLVRLSSLPDKEQARLGGADVALDPNDVGAWFFKPSRRPKGSKVEEIKLDPETGLFPTDYDQVSDALYNEGAHIFNSQQQGGTK